MAVTLLGGAPPGVLPTTIAGLKLWVHPESGFWEDAAKTNPCEDGTTIYTWADASGNGYDLIQSTAADRPTCKTGIINGYTVLRTVDGSDYVFHTPLSDLISASAYTVFVVFNQTGLQGSTNYILADGNTKMVALTSGATSNAYSTLNDDGAADTATDLTSITFNAWNLGCSMHSGGNIYAGGNAVLTANMTSAASGNTAATASLLVGLGIGGINPYRGDVAEIIIYNVALTEGERVLIAARLAWKYGLTVS